MSYVVIKAFRDLQDKEQHVYMPGDKYNGKMTKARLEELTTDKNKLKEPLIKKEEEE